MYPFKQSQKGDTIIREFAEDVSSQELVWHRDLCDRHVQILEGSDWYLQVDNQIPKKLVEGRVYFIPAHNYHRLIKGTSKLVVSIKENRKMKITKRQLRQIIRESRFFQMGMSGKGITDNPDADLGFYDDMDDMTGFGYVEDYDDFDDGDFGDIGESNDRLLEYEQYVDEDGNVYDDEGNVTRRGKAFGRRYGGGTYGTRGLPPGGRSRGSRRKTSYVGSEANAEKIAAIEAALEKKPNNFLKSILDQLKKGRGLSSKQKGIVRKILAKTDAEAAALFEGIIREGNASVDYMIGYEDARDDLPMNSDDGYYAMGYADYLEGKHDDYEQLIKDQQQPPYVREGKKEMHRCMDGQMVSADSEDCLFDIVARIEDAEYHRNSHSCGTENRIYYNGLLKGLRNKRNKLKKVLYVG